MSYDYNNDMANKFHHVWYYYKNIKKKEIDMVKIVLTFLKLQQSQYQHTEQTTERL
jgi:hypothetical protein